MNGIFCEVHMTDQLKIRSEMTMAKLLRNKLAMALCCTVVMGVPMQASSVLETDEIIQEVQTVIGQETQVTTGGSITIGQEKVEGTQISVGQESADAWENIVDDAQYLGNIEVLHETKDEPSMAASFFTQEDLPIQIRDDKVYVTLRIEKDVNFGGTPFTDPINSVSQMIDNDYQSLVLNYLQDESIRFITTEICITDINEAEFLKCYVVPMAYAPTLRIKLTEETISMLQAELDKEEQENADTWNDMVNNAQYLGDIKVLHATKDEPSMAADFFEQETLPIEIRDGKVYLTLKVSKDGLGVQNAITSLAQKQDGTFTELELKGLNDDSVRYVTTEIGIDNINEATTLQCGINTGFMQMTQELRIFLGDETISMLQAELDKEETAVVADGTYLVDIDILKAGSNEPSHSASSFNTENTYLTMRDGEASLALIVKRDSGAFTDMIGGLDHIVNGENVPLNLVYTEVNDERVAIAEIALDDLEAKAAIICHIQNPFTHSPELGVKLTEESLNDLKQGTSEKIIPVVVSVTEGASGDSITINATGGNGAYEYTIDGGTTWQSEAIFTGLEAGTYKVVARDANNTLNVSSTQEVTLGEKEDNGDPGVADGTYLVDINVLHETEDKESHAASYFDKEAIQLTVKEGKAYLKVKVARDSGGFTDIIQGLEQKVGAEFVPMELQYIEEEGQRYVASEIALESVVDTAYINTKIVLPFMSKEYVLRVKLTDESIAELTQGTAVKTVSITTEKTDLVGTLKGSIKVSASGGNGTYEYSIDGGTTWQSEATFTGLEAGIYKVVARDAAHISNSSGVQEVTLVQKEISNNEGLADGSYSVNIKILQETSDQTSMAAQFFNQEGLPLEIVNGKAYLTIQVLKDGMGMKDVITSLEQKINGGFQALSLDYLDDSSKRYVTTEVVFDSIDTEAYLRCGIAPMGSMKPVLRIKLDKDSIEVGSGNIDTGLKAEMAASINSVVAENGKVTINLAAADETLTAEDFAGKIYLNGSDTGKTVTLKDFKMNEEVVTFTFDEVKQTEENQTVKVGITLNEVETKSNEFVVKGSAVTVESPQKVTLKENAKEMKYIAGYEDGTFRANQQVTNAEMITMLTDLIDVPTINYYSAQIDVLQSEKNEASMAKQFFKTEGIQIKKQAHQYFVELEISNEGLGFTNIITNVEQKVDGVFKTVEVQKSSDLKTAYVTLEVDDLSKAIILKTGIAPMGSVAPELRIVIDESSLKESAYESQFTDIDMWAKEDIELFESLGLIGGEGETIFNPNKAITRGECVRLITLIAGLDIKEENEHPFADSVGHEYENYITAAYEAGFIKGYEDESFRPDQTLSRAEVVAMINRFIGHDESTNVDIVNPFADLTASHWAYQEILKVVQV